MRWFYLSVAETCQRGFGLFRHETLSEKLPISALFQTAWQTTSRVLYTAFLGTITVKESKLCRCQNNSERKGNMPRSFLITKLQKRKDCEDGLVATDDDGERVDVATRRCIDEDDCDQSTRVHHPAVSTELHDVSVTGEAGDNSLTDFIGTLTTAAVHCSVFVPKTSRDFTVLKRQ